MMRLMTFHTCTRLASMLILTFAIAIAARAASLLRCALIGHALARHGLGLPHAETGNRIMPAADTPKRFALQACLDFAASLAKWTAGVLPKDPAPWQRAHDMFLAPERAVLARR